MSGLPHTKILFSNPFTQQVNIYLVDLSNSKTYKPRMATNLKQELLDLEHEWLDPHEHLPGELTLDLHHPMNDAFQRRIDELSGKIQAFGRLMPKKKRDVAKLYCRNLTTRDIAKRVDVCPQTVRKWLRLPKVAHLVLLIEHLKQAIDGPNLEHRKGILYRIAIDNEEKRPNISIMAIQEINKMSHSYAQPEQQAGNVVNIQINGELLPRGSLDTLPETFENKAIAPPIEGKLAD